eukprot:364195-Chlamydomonas_euryale.AAC.2
MSCSGVFKPLLSNPSAAGVADGQGKGGEGAVPSSARQSDHGSGLEVKIVWQPALSTRAQLPMFATCAAKVRTRALEPELDQQRNATELRN